MRPLPVLLIAPFILALSVQPAGAGSTQEPCTPRIESVVPSTVFVGERVVVRGTCLTSDFGDGKIRLSLGEAPVTIISASETEIVADVNSRDPADALTLASGADKTSVQFEVRNWIEPPVDEFRAGVIEVQMKPGADINDVATQLGGQDMEPIFAGWDFPELQGWWRLHVEGDTIIRVREWAAHPDVLWAQPDIVAQAELTSPPDDPCYPGPTPPSCDVIQYTHPITGVVHGDDGQWGIQRIAAEEAWPIERGDPSIRIAVMDQAIDTGSGELHAEIGSRVVVARDFTGSGLAPHTDHGTRVAGVAAASTDNSLGVAGVAPDVSIVSYKVFGPCCPMLAQDWELALLYAISDEADVVNMSFRGFGYDALTETVINAAHNNGIVLVAATGNDGKDMDTPDVFYFPAEYNHVIAVAATDQSDERPDWSNYGSAVDLGAPGEDIMSTNWSQGGGGFFGVCAGATYCADSGTSFSAPMVSGVAALLASRGFYGCEIVETLTGTDQFGDPISADPITWSGGGVGRLNAQKALEWWGGGPIVSDTVWPDGAIIHEEGSSDRYVNNGGLMQLVTGFDERNDQCVPPAVFNAIGDSDGDGWINGVDNCPSWPNAGQQLPPWFVPVGDSDCDGYPDTVQVGSHAPESFLGTDPASHCAADTVANNEPPPDAWPLDFDDNRLIDNGDVLRYNLPFGAIGPEGPDTLYKQRLDLNADNIIDLGDVLQFNLTWGSSCVP